ncbi:MAG: uroporphyrinogen decarboxylase/cobalamine-independent methonine synthase family protein [Armatimonadota bacterium]
MEQWVKEALDQIDELYPPERLQKSTARWEALWNPDDYPAEYPLQLSACTVDYYNGVHTPEQRLRKCMDECILHGMIGDDFLPGLFPGCRQSTIPNMFGAPEIIAGEDTTCNPLVFQPEDVFRLPEPCIAPESVAQQWLNMQSYLMNETEGRIPIHVADMQGPMDVCGKLWGYDGVLAAAYEEPEAFERILELATQAFILLWKAQKELLGELFVPTHLYGWSYAPKHMGATVSVDSLVMISPSFYKKYFRPSLETIGRELGPTAIHSCGDWSAVVGEVCQTEGVIGVNVSQMELQQLVDAGMPQHIVATENVWSHQLADQAEIIKRHSLRAEVNIIDPPMAPFYNQPKQNWPEENIRELRENMLRYRELFAEK